MTYPARRWNIQLNARRWGSNINPPPPANSRTNGWRETHGVAIESSQREDSNECLIFSVKGHVWGYGQAKGQKARVWIIGRGDRNINTSVVELSTNASK